MKIHLFGNGKMGKMIAALCPELGFTLSPFEEADVCIDFSHATKLFDHLEKANLGKKALVIGTTGWDEKREEVKSFVDKHQMAVIASPNFSLGVFLTKALLKEAAKKIGVHNVYDVAGVEVHHSAKVDSPSGTALAFKETIDANFGKTCSFSSVRTGFVPGTHTVFFDSPFDTITITHTARNREGFARGALMAASWIYERKGFFTFEECMESLK